MTDPLLLDEGDPRAAPRSFRRALAQYATGVCVVSAEAEGRQAFVTVNSFASVSMEPPLVLWSQRRESTSLPVMEGASHFAVNVLAAGQVEIASRFAKSAADGERIDGLATGAGGAPLLDGVAATFECRRVAAHAGGDHVIWIGEVERYRCYDRAGLAFAQGRYALAVDHPATAAPASPGTAASPAPDDALASLLLRAHAGLTADLDRQREEVGLDLDQSKALAWLARAGSGSVAALAQGTLLTLQAAQDAVVGLSGKDLASPRPPGGVALTDAGRQVAADLGARAEAQERARLGAFDPEAVATARRVLRALAEG